MRIGVDIDDTLAETTEYIMPLYLEFDRMHAKGKGIMNPHKKHNDAFDWSEEEVKLMRDDYIEKIVYGVPMRKDASKFLNLIKQLGHEIIVITARTKLYYPDPYSLSKRWLEKHNIPFDELRTDALKKGEVCIDAKIDLFIDDSFGQASFVAEHLMIPVLMPVDAYNKDKECLGITKVYSWSEIYNIILQMTRLE